MKYSDDGITVLHFKFSDFLLSIGGDKNFYDVLSSVEIYTKEKKSCKLPDLPEDIREHSAIYSTIGIISCGGVNKSIDAVNKCWRLNDKLTWEKFAPLQLSRRDFTLNQINDRLVAVGGSGGKHWFYTLEYIDVGKSNVWTSKKLDDVTLIKSHCSVTINEQFIMLIGGIQNSPEVSEITSNSKNDDF